MPLDLQTYYTPGNVNVQTNAPGVSLPGLQGASLGGPNMNGISQFANQMLQYKMAQQAKQQRMQQAQYEREMALKEQALAQSGQSEADRLAFAREQWQALQDEQNRMVPLYRPLISGGPGYTGGYGQATTNGGGAGNVAAGWVRAGDAGQYSAPKEAAMMPYQAPPPNTYSTATPGQTALGGKYIPIPETPFTPEQERQSNIWTSMQNQMYGKQE